jgi:hypothetical protein
VRTCRANRPPHEYHCRAIWPPIARHHYATRWSNGACRSANSSPSASRCCAIRRSNANRCHASWLQNARTSGNPTNSGLTQLERCRRLPLPLRAPQAALLPLPVEMSGNHVPPLRGTPCARSRERATGKLAGANLSRRPERKFLLRQTTRHSQNSLHLQSLPSENSLAIH